MYDVFCLSVVAALKMMLLSLQAKMCPMQDPNFFARRLRLVHTQGSDTCFAARFADDNCVMADEFHA